MTKAVTIPNCTIGVARPRDIPRLLTINHRWQRGNLTHLQNGFLSVTYDEAFLEKAIIKRDMMASLE